MSQKLWVAYDTPAKRFGPTRVSIEGCSDTADFKEEIKKQFSNTLGSFDASQLSLYKSDGITEIDVEDSATLLVDGNSSKNPLIVKTLLFALNDAPTSVKSPLIGQVLSVNINQNKLIKQYLTPAGSSCSTPVENSPESVDISISSLGLILEQSTFLRNTTARPCIVINVEPRPLEVELEEPPNITIVLITGFDGQPLDQVMAEEEFKRVMPILPTTSLPGTAAPINTTPEWIPHSRRRVPSYILCIPIKVHSLYLHRFEEPIQLDEQNLEKLKLHILALGGIEANADSVDLAEEEDDDESDDDDVELSYGQFKRLISWDEITM